jgi:nicotinamide-nucleotide amidase
MSSAQQVFDALLNRNWKVSTAESCTGGMVAAALTDIAGSSAIFDRGFVTYSNAAKVEMLAVPVELITQFGAVSEQVALAMAQGALLQSAADVAVSITGIAGPSGGSSEKPVGLVHFAIATREDAISFVQRFGNESRKEIRQKSVVFAFEKLCAQLASGP